MSDTAADQQTLFLFRWKNVFHLKMKNGKGRKLRAEDGKDWFKVWSCLLGGEMKDNGTQAIMWGVGAGYCMGHILEVQTEVVALYRMIWNTKFKTINENYHFQKKTPSDLNLKKIKFERTFNEEKQRKKIGKQVEIKVLVLQFNKEKSMQSWMPSNLAQLWSSRRKK